MARDKDEGGGMKRVERIALFIFENLALSILIEQRARWIGDRVLAL